MNNIILNWVPAVDASSQIAKWRLRGDSLWNTTSFSPANPLLATASTTTRTNIATNTVYEFKVEGDCGETAIMEAIKFQCTTPLRTALNSPNRLKVDFGTMSHIDSINLKLFTSGGTLIASSLITAQPLVHEFTGVTPGSYYITYTYNATINGNPVSSGDILQVGAECQSDTFTFDP